MPTVPLPEHPNLEHLKNQAKLVRDLIRSGDDGALQMIDEFHPRLASGSGVHSEFKLSDAQLIVARLYRCSSWSALKAEVEKRRSDSRSPDLVEADPTSVSHELLRRGCLRYGAGDVAAGLDEANDLLEKNPEVVRESVFTMAAVGDVEGLDALIGAGAVDVNAGGGPFDWPPLLYLTYSRLSPPAPSWVDGARALLAAGADPNAGFLWHGLVPPFTALTGALGRGERDQPPHVEAMALARLLLERGADPNDSQALYNNGWAGTARDTTDHLELLFEFGLGEDKNGPWYQRLGSALPAPDSLPYGEIEMAAARNLPRRLSFVLGRLDLDLDRPGERTGLAPYRVAAQRGHREVCDLLAGAGATIVELDPIEELVRAIREGDRAALVAADAEAVAALRDAQPRAIAMAAEHGHEELVQSLVDLGFDINQGGGPTALHEAAVNGRLEIAKLLIELGADADATEPGFNATPLGWAQHAGQQELVDFLRPLTSEA